MKITVITVTYNSARTVRDTLRSVLQQDYAELEYIVVDGASTDGTPDILREFQPRFGGRMRLLSEPDNGLYDAMNKGIRLATGDVVGMLNSDDFFSAPDALSTIARAFTCPEGAGGAEFSENSEYSENSEPAEASPSLPPSAPDAVYADVHFVHPDDLCRPVRYYSSRHFSRRWMRFGFMPAHPTFYCRRELYLRYGLYDTSYRVAADFECLLRLIFIHHIRTRYVPRDLVTMRTGGASTRGMKSHLCIMRDHRRALRANGVRSGVVLLALRYPYKLLDLWLHRRRLAAPSPPPPPAL